MTRRHLDRSFRIHNIGAQRRGQMLEAIPKNIFSTSFRLQQQNQPLGEVGTSIWREKARLEIGTIYPLGVFTLRTSIDLPADWPLPIRVFLFWLAFVIWKRQNQAAAS